MVEFRLIKENFSDKDQEKQWTYQCLFRLVFNQVEINQITITDYYQCITNWSDSEIASSNQWRKLKTMKYKGQREP